MQIMKLRRMLCARRKGAALILMVLLIVVFCTLIWLDPMSLIHGSGSNMPWNEERRLVAFDREVKQPKEEQPRILDNLIFEGQIVEDNDVKGGLTLFILTNGRIKGIWTGTYKPEPDITWEVQQSRFKGNIDPAKIYSDKDGEDQSKLYFIAKGSFLILETNSKTNNVKTAAGAIYITGWLDNKYNAVGKITITSDKKTYWEYYWQDRGEKTLMVPDFGPSLPKLF